MATLSQPKPLWGEKDAIPIITIGVDVGQRTDPTAIAVVEQERRSRLPYNPEPEVHHVVRFLDRLALGTSYPEVGERIAEICMGLFKKLGGFPMLYMDATGVGQPVVDIIQRMNLPVRIRPVYFTHGDRRLEKLDKITQRPMLMLGKGWLVSRLQSLMQAQLLHVPRTPESQAMIEELRVYEIRIDDKANDRYGAFAVGKHDDLVTALGLAVQTDGGGSGSFIETRRGSAILPTEF